MIKVEALNENRDFARLYKRGKNMVHPLLVTYVQKNRFKKTRIGITATKKVGNAVERNRCKRVITAAFRELSCYHDCGYDIVFVARVRTKTVKMQKVKAAMEQHLSALTGVRGKDLAKE